jgi:hypothetical protein
MPFDPSEAAKEPCRVSLNIGLSRPIRSRSEGSRRYCSMLLTRSVSRFTDLKQCKLRLSTECDTLEGKAKTVLLHQGAPSGHQIRIRHYLLYKSCKAANRRTSTTLETSSYFQTFAFLNQQRISLLQSLEGYDRASTFYDKNDTLQAPSSSWRRCPLVSLPCVCSAGGPWPSIEAAEGHRPSPTQLSCV